MSGFRPDLDLSGILGSYGRWTQPEEESPVEKDTGPKYPSPTRLGAWGAPEACSTCTDVAVPIVLKWDVNGYYRALGVDPNASRRELMQAYMAKNGQDSPWLTYCFKQLLNPKTRADYDSTPLGEPFLDEYTQAEIRQAAARHAMMNSRAGKAINANEVLEEWGFVVDDTDPEVPLEQAPPPRPRPARTFPYRYYAWRTSEYLQSEDILAEWQSALVSAAADLGIKTEIAIGITSGSPGFIVDRTEDNIPLIYLTENTQISNELAHNAIKAAQCD